MFINGLIFWGLVLNPGPILLTQLSPGTRIAMMHAVIPPQIVLGAMMSIIGVLIIMCKEVISQGIYMPGGK